MSAYQIIETEFLRILRKARKARDFCLAKSVVHTWREFKTNLNSPIERLPTRPDKGLGEHGKVSQKVTGEVNKACICKGFYQPANCPIHGTNHTK